MTTTVKTVCLNQCVIEKIERYASGNHRGRRCDDEQCPKRGPSKTEGCGSRQEDTSIPRAWRQREHQTHYDSQGTRGRKDIDLEHGVC